MYNAVIDAPFGKVGIRTEGDAVREVIFLPASVANVAPDTRMAKRAVEQIEHYFEHASATFDLPLAPVGTPFQRRVWGGISRIAPGTVQTYGQLANEVGSVPRAVGQACGSNYFPIVIPCHRVVGSNWIGGFAHHNEEGFLRDVKRWLLAHESLEALPLWQAQA